MKIVIDVPKEVIHAFFTGNGRFTLEEIHEALTMALCDYESLDRTIREMKEKRKQESEETEVQDA